MSLGKVSSTVMQPEQYKKIHHSEKQQEEVAMKLERFLTACLIRQWSYKDLFELITTELPGVRAKRQTRRENQ